MESHAFHVPSIIAFHVDSGDPADGRRRIVRKFSLDFCKRFSYARCRTHLHPFLPVYDDVRCRRTTFKINKQTR